MNDKQQEIANRIAQIKLKRIQELNSRLKEALKRDRIPASNACLSIINHTQETPDYLIPYVWKLPPEQNKFQRYQDFRNMKSSSSSNASCCTIM